MVCAHKQNLNVKCCFITTDMGCILSLPSTGVLIDSHETKKYEKIIMTFNVVLYNTRLSEKKTKEFRENICIFFFLNQMKNRQSFRIAIGFEETAKKEKAASYQYW